MSYYVYILRCKDNSLYTGFTRDVRQRVCQHNSGFRGAKSLRGKTPVVLVYLETYLTIKDALNREREIKGWRKERKEKLVALALNSEAMKRR